VHALVVRCLAQNGIALTPEQSETLEEWQERTGIRD
jgi:DNA replication protein DnaD